MVGDYSGDCGKSRFFDAGVARCELNIQAPPSPCSAYVASKLAATNSRVLNIRFTPLTLPPIRSSPGRCRLLRMAEICASGRWSAFMAFVNSETLKVLVESDHP